MDMSLSKKQKSSLGIIGVLLLAIVIVEAYCIVDQAVTITYMKDGYRMVEGDLKTIVKIVNTTDLSKIEVERSLENNPAFEGMLPAGDTIQLQQHEMIFRNNQLLKIVPIDR